MEQVLGNLKFGQQSLPWPGECRKDRRDGQDAGSLNSVDDSSAKCENAASLQAQKWDAESSVEYIQIMNTMHCTLSSNADELPTKSSSFSPAKPQCWSPF